MKSQKVQLHSPSRFAGAHPSNPCSCHSAATHATGPQPTETPASRAGGYGRLRAACSREIAEAYGGRGRTFGARGYTSAHGCAPGAGGNRVAAPGTGWQSPQGTHMPGPCKCSPPSRSHETKATFPRNEGRSAEHRGGRAQPIRPRRSPLLTRRVRREHLRVELRSGSAARKGLERLGVLGGDDGHSRGEAR